MANPTARTRPRARRTGRTRFAPPCVPVLSRPGSSGAGTAPSGPERLRRASMASGPLGPLLMGPLDLPRQGFGPHGLFERGHFGIGPFDRPDAAGDEFEQLQDLGVLL